MVGAVWPELASKINSEHTLQQKWGPTDYLYVYVCICIYIIYMYTFGFTANINLFSKITSIVETPFNRECLTIPMIAEPNLSILSQHALIEKKIGKHENFNKCSLMAWSESDISLNFQRYITFTPSAHQ